MNAGSAQVKEAEKVNEISVELSVGSIQRQSQAFNARTVALNAGSAQVKEVKEFSVQISVGEAFNAGSQVKKWLSTENVKNLAADSVDERYN